MTILPVVPTSIITQFGDDLYNSILDEMISMQEEASASGELRDYIFKKTREVFKNATTILFSIRTGKLSNELNTTITTTKDIILSLLATVSESCDQNQREGRLSNAIEKFTETRMLLHFFSNGNLASKSLVEPCSDDEYIGASLSFAQELSRYVVGRACEFDTVSIDLCRSLMCQLNEKMLMFDFRNGSLRRKYDGLKYVIKNIENITYELSLLNDSSNYTANDVTDSPPAKKAKCFTSTTTDATTDATTGATAVVATAEDDLINAEDMETIRVKMEAYDKRREDVIKNSRDVQKLSKQSIFALHRNNINDAKDKLAKALVIANQINDSIMGYPSLRYGAFSSSLEEWAEGAMTLEWIEKKRIMLKKDVSICNSQEYIGALSDFTGEIGRIAVQKASIRDITEVKKIMECHVTISSAMMILNVDGKYTKKADAVAQNLKKVETIVYDLSMLNNGARGSREREAEPDINTKDDNNDE